MPRASLTTGPTTNIVGRVTGNVVSNILGTIDTLDFGRANLFLINPAGVIFGATAKLNVGGSFHVSTADYVRFADPQQSQYFASLSKTSSLTAEAPDAFGFLGPIVRSITIKGATLEVPAGQMLSLVGPVSVSTGQTLSVVGGAIELAGSSLTARSGQVQLLAGTGIDTGGLKTPDATLKAPSGRILLGSVPAPGVVNLDISPIVAGRIDLSNGAIIDVGGSPTGAGGAGGSVVIRGGQLFASGGALITAATTASASGAQPGIDVQMTGDVFLTGGAGLQVMTFKAPSASSAGNAGKVRITASSLQMDTSAFIESIAFGDNSGRGGDVGVSVGQLNLTGSAQILSNTGQTPAASGPGGNLIINATNVTLAGAGSSIFSSTGSTAAGGVGGAITITAPSVTITDRASVSTTASNAAPGGAITVQATNLSLTSGAQLNSQGQATGRGGTVTVTAPGLATMSGTGTGIVSSGSATAASAGDIIVSAGTLLLTDSAKIENGNTHKNGGDITVTATDSIVMTGGASIGSQAFSTPVGRLAVSAPRLTMDVSLIEASTIEAGRAGDITVTVTGDLALTGGAQIATGSVEVASGPGGNLTISAGSVSISGRSPRGPASTFSNDTSSGLFSTAESTGPGGNIDVLAGQIALNDGATISARSSGTRLTCGGPCGPAGNLKLASTGAFRIQDGIVTTEATTADGGNIALTAGSRSLLYLTDSRITTSVQGGQGKGGNITIDPRFVILDHSQVRADAFGGPGGNIDIAADVFLASESVISASSALSTSGAINIQAQITDLSGSVAPLPAGLLQAATLLRASCAARVAAGKASSLVVAGREGLPLEPGGYLPSPLLAQELGDVGPSRSEGHHWETFPRISRSVLTPTCPR